MASSITLSCQHLQQCCQCTAGCLSCAPRALLPQLCAQCTGSRQGSACGALLRQQCTRRTHGGSAVRGLHCCGSGSAVHSWPRPGAFWALLLKSCENRVRIPPRQAGRAPRVRVPCGRRAPAVDAVDDQRGASCPASRRGEGILVRSTYRETLEDLARFRLLPPLAKRHPDHATACGNCGCSRDVGPVLPRRV
eukprot:COSAG03_NODE_2167_length_3057_cov_9.477011_1_plen_193_part_00